VGWAWGFGLIFPLLVTLQAVEYAKHVFDLEVGKGTGIPVFRGVVKSQVHAIEMAQTMVLKGRTFRRLAKKPHLDRPVEADVRLQGNSMAHVKITFKQYIYKNTFTEHECRNSAE
jgi:hypothetical protein